MQARILQWPSPGDLLHSNSLAMAVPRLRPEPRESHGELGCKNRHLPVPERPPATTLPA